MSLNTFKNVNKIQQKRESIDKKQPLKQYNPLNDKYFLTIFSAYTAFSVVYLSWYLFDFRSYASQKNIWVVPFQQLSVKIAILFFTIMATKIFCEHIIGHRLTSVVHPRYHTDHQNMYSKGLFLGVRLYDCLSNFLILSYIYYLFRQQQWFPTVIGGCGSCQQMSKSHPHVVFSEQNKQGITNVLAILVATFLYENCELLIIKRGDFVLNFGDVLLHHFMAFFVTLFAGLYNYYAVVVTSAFLFDISDFYQNLTRLVHYSKVAVMYPNLYMVAEWICICLWWLTRGALLFMCHINPLYQSAYGTNTTQANLFWIHVILLSLLVGLLCLNGFWVGAKAKKIKEKIKKNYEQSQLWLEKQRIQKQKTKND